MSQQDGTQSSTKQRRSRKTNTANQQNGKQALAVQHPANDDKDAWKVYWKEQGQSWRTEPEIDMERQKYLAERRNISPNIEQGIYPFKDIKLSRADVEWLLATHENGRGPVDWNDSSQNKREGIDIRGADLRYVDLHNLPLARMHGGLKGSEWLNVTEGQQEIAAVHLEGANLRYSHLEEAILNGAHLEGADLRDASLQKIKLSNAYLQETDLRNAHLWKASIGWAHLERAKLSKSNLEDAFLNGTSLENARLGEANLKGAALRGVHFEKAVLNYAFLENTDLFAAYFENTLVYGINLADKHHIGPQVADAQWSNVNLAVMSWAQIKMLGDEYKARQKTYDGKGKDSNSRLEEYEQAVRANRQLATALQAQGLNEEADHFAYRAQKLQRVVLRRQRKFGRYLFSGFLDLLAGYGYRPLRSVIIYLFVIAGFALGYYVVTHFLHAQPYPLAWYEALILSVSSFHGRGFFQPVQSLGDPVAILASIEAVFGLLIEISFIATFTQRFFGK